MAGRRLIPASAVTDYEARLQAATDLAMRDMSASIRHQLRSHGIEPPTVTL